jgi:hypothetical protein
MTRDYPIKTPARSGVLTVAERADRIDLTLTFDRYGDLGDGDAILRQLLPALATFDRDPRPLRFVGPDLGCAAVIDFDAAGRPCVTVTAETRQ